MELIHKLSKKPQLYEKGTSVMWTDPYISEQLLELHINPDHDVASRSKVKIENTTNWILDRAGKPGLSPLIPKFIFQRIKLCFNVVKLRLKLRESE